MTAKRVCVLKCLCVIAFHLQVGLWVQVPQVFLSVPEEGTKKRLRWEKMHQQV